MVDPPETHRTASAITDAVTGVLPRGALQGCLDEAMVAARQAGGCCSVFLFDVDHFKTVNDAYGHARGDDVLRQIAERVGRLARDSDLLIRYGGDEFVLVLPGTGRMEAMQAALRLVEGVNSSPFPGNPPLSVSISLGVATYPDDAAGQDELIEVADRRNYLAKRRGRGRAVADDLASNGRATSGRLLERDAALAAAQDFLVRLPTQGRGALRVVGERGAGHSRFLAEVVKLARLRGFEVRAADGTVDQPPGGDHPEAGRILVVADTDADWVEVSRLVHDLAEADHVPQTLGLIQACHDPAGVLLPLPLIGTVSLPRLSASALRIWLRTSLSGEPSPTLVEWLATRSGGLMARAERELARLAEGGSLERGTNGGWSVSPGAVARAGRARRRLPTTLSSLIGRTRETSQIEELLAARRLVTLVGPGGIGKTRLSLAVAGAMADEYDDGAVFVSLAEATTTSLVVAAVAAALEIAEGPDEPLADTVTERLRDCDILLVLDNFEQVLAAAPFVADLLAAGPGVRVLATSRQRLRLSGEQVYQVGPLPLPDLDHLPARPEDVVAALATSPALALFVARAQEAAYDLRLSLADVRAAAEICHRLDGLPLAIELAAARCGMLTVPEVLSQLTERFELLTEGPQDLPTRQQTMRATIDWSFALLDPDARELMSTLAVFTGGCPIQAVAPVCLPSAGTGTSAADRLSALTDENLLSVTTTPDGPRYTMLETIRAYAGERLAASPDADDVRHRHATYFATLAEEAGRELTGPAQAEWIARLNRDYLNIRTAMDWAMTAGDLATAARIAHGLGKYWSSGQHINEGRDWYSRILAAPAHLPDRLHSQLLDNASFLAMQQGDLDQAHRYGEECVRIARDLDDPKLIAAGLNVLGLTAEISGEYDLCRAYHTEQLALEEKLGHKFGIAVARGNLTILALDTDDLDTAYKYAQLNLDLETEIGNARGVALTLRCLGTVHIRRAELVEARPLLTRSVEVSRQINDVICEAEALYSLGLVAELEGDPAGAYGHFTAALKLCHAAGERETLTAALCDIAGLLAPTDPTRAARLLSAASTIREKHRLKVHQHQSDRCESALRRVQSLLTDTELTAAWSTGAHTPLDHLIEETLTTTPTLAP